MSTAYLAQPDQQQKLEWLDGGFFSVLLDGTMTGGQLTVGRFDVSKGEAPPYHVHTREDEVFMLITRVHPRRRQPRAGRLQGHRRPVPRRRARRGARRG